MPPTEQVDGRFYTSKSQFRAVGKALGLIEVGNEKPKPRQRASSQEKFKKGRHEAIGKAVAQYRAGRRIQQRRASSVDEFAKTHPRFDELAEQIKYWLERGLTLGDAYIVADTLRPSRRKMIEAAMKRIAA